MTEKEVYKQIVDKEPYCQLCGSCYELHIHHIIYRSQGGLTIPENLIRLCCRCHRLVHSNKREWLPKLLERQHSIYGNFEEKDLKRSNKWMKTRNTYNTKHL